MSNLGRAAVLVVALLLGAAPSLAAPTAADENTRNAARALAAEGDALFAKQAYEEAADRFSRAYALVHAPTISVRWARSLVKLGMLIEAEEEYVATVRTELPADAPEAFRTAVAEATQELSELKARIPKLEIVRPAGVGAVRMDGQSVPDALIGVARPIDPGAHVIEADGAAGERVDIAEGETRSVTLRRSGPAASTPSSGRRTAGFVALGLGAAGVATGVVAGIIALSDRNVLEQQCTPDGACPAARAGNIDAYHTAGTISTVGFVVGGVALATGVVLVLTGKPKVRARELGPSLADRATIRF